MRAKLSDRPPPAGVGARHAVTAAVIQPSRFLVLLLTLAFAAGLRVPDAVQYLPFAASLLFFGLPHGAMDHLVPSRLAGRRPDARGVLGVVLLYAALSCLFLIVWFASPVVAFASFVCLTAYHWGAGDLHALLFFGPPDFAPTGRAARAAFLAGRGCIPMLVPLVLFPDDYRGVAKDALGLFDTDLAGVANVSGSNFSVVFLAGLAAAVALSLLPMARDLRARRAALVPVVGETAMLFTFFAVVPPVLAVGLYFTTWHATRHVARLVLLEGDASGPLPRYSWRWAIRRFARDATPLTVVALALLAALFFAVPAVGVDAGTLLAVYLLLVSLLTLPHAAVVTYMDRLQGVWER